MARGGRRTPASPAPVSGPGALSQRTDGGPAPAVSEAGGQAYGERQALEGMEGAEPSVGGGGGGGMPPAGMGGAPPMAPIDLFGPTDFPDEPMTAGIDNEGIYSQSDPEMLVRLAYQIYPHPSLARLIPEY